MTIEAMRTTPNTKLVRARGAFGWSQAKCDKAAGVPVGRAYSYERADSHATPTRAYLEPLAEAWGIPLTWFFDGVDDQPPTDRPAASRDDARPSSIPLRGDVPHRSGRVFPEADPVPALTTFSLPPDCGFWRIGGNMGALRRGDLILIAPDDQPRRDTIMLLTLASGTVDVYHIVREAGREVSRPMSDDQEDAGDDWTAVGYAVQVRRTMAEGRVVSFECETGLSPEMLSLA